MVVMIKSRENQPTEESDTRATLQVHWAVEEPVATPSNLSTLQMESTEKSELFTALLADPDRTWTVAEMAARLPAVSVSSLRTILLVMVGDRLLEIETTSRQHRLTLRLSRAGQRILTDVLSQAESDTADAATLPAGGERNVR